MNKTGIVMKVQNKKACIMTEDGQFLDVAVKGEAPSIGEVYCGSAVVPVFSPKRAAAAAVLIFAVLAGSLAYTYNAEAASMVFDSNSEIRLGINRWNVIIKAEALNKDGKKVLDAINVKYKPLNSGLSTIADEVKKENLIDQNNKDNPDKKDEINILFDAGKADKIPDISEFKKNMKDNNVNVVVDFKKDKKSDNYNMNKNIKSRNTEINNSKQDAKTRVPNNDDGYDKNHTSDGNSGRSNNNIKKNSGKETVNSESRTEAGSKGKSKSETDANGGNKKGEKDNK